MVRSGDYHGAFGEGSFDRTPPNSFTNYAHGPVSELITLFDKHQKDQPDVEEDYKIWKLLKKLTNGLAFMKGINDDELARIATVAQALAHVATPYKKDEQLTAFERNTRGYVLALFDRMYSAKKKKCADKILWAVAKMCALNLDRLPRKTSRRDRTL
ncbi:hypothetical protein PTTG_26640 [Puccinia triticina 1-1 BBBD Race 1]|uniref:Uncharacterized protein n=1 Tax=Puccinia triticina (isolate 1-1 / race 1 (BBBD)) TaxID=630390 RepID=A0A180GT11_PUCT1|nr:hypothetical protein PTTG_26640 [Puccinia triticina 1-1 BBBD Race 1]